MRKQLCIPVMIRQFFDEYLPLQRGCSPHTISAYSDTFSLLLKYFHREKRISPSRISIDDFSPRNIRDFLDYLQKKRGNSANTRNARLAAINSFIKYLLIEDPMLSGKLQGILSIPLKRKEKKALDFLSCDEMDAILATPNEKTWCGKRDRVLFSVMYNTGARVSEIVDIKVADVRLEKNGTIKLFGKGRKERTLPLWKSTTSILRQWIKWNGYSNESPLFPSQRGSKMTRSAVAKRLTAIIADAKQKCPTLKSKSISPHTLRHSTAMRFLQAGIDITVIAMWLGHENVDTTHFYITSDMQMKQKALEAVLEPNKSKKIRFKASNSLIEYLENL